MDLGYPPPPISAENIELVRVVDPATKKVVTKRVDKVTGMEVGLTETFHLQGVEGHFDPAPS